MRVHATPILALLLASSLACASLAGCEGKQTKLAPEVENLEASTSDSANAEIWKISADGDAKFTMEGKIETIVGELSSTRGQLDIDLKDLTRTRGSVEMDLFTLETSTFEEAGKNAKQTVDALTWLEVAERGADVANRAKNQWAVFAIRSIDKAEPADITAVAGDKRKALITATGDFLLHGRRSVLTVQLEADFEFSEGKPAKLEIETAAPMVVNLAAHDVRPRDNVGKLLATITDALKLKVADDAKITFELDATPTGKMMVLPAAPAPTAPAPAAPAPTAPAAPAPAPTAPAPTP